MKKVAVRNGVFIVLMILSIGTLFTMYMFNKTESRVTSSQPDGSGKKDSGGTILTFYFPGREKSEVGIVLKKLEERARENGKLDIKLDFQWIPYDYYPRVEKLINPKASKDAKGTKEDMDSVDAFYYSKYLNGDDNEGTLRNWIKNGYVKDISELFPKDAPQYYKKINSDGDLSACKIDGKFYAFPNHYPRTSRSCAVIRDDTMKKDNSFMVNSYQDVDKYIEQSRKGNNSSFLLISDTTIRPFAEAFGYVVLDYKLGLVYKWDDWKKNRNIEVIPWEKTPEFKALMETLGKWSNGIDQLMLAPENSTIRGGKFSFIEGYPGADDYYNLILKAMSSSSWRYKSYILYPHQITQRELPIDRSIVFNARSKNVELTIRFLEWLQSDQESYDLLMYGIKGKDYILYGNQVALPKTVDIDRDVYINWSGRDAFVNSDHERAGIASDPDFIDSYKEFMNKYTKYPPHMGFYPDYSKIDEVPFYKRNTAFDTISNILRNMKSKKDVESFIQDKTDDGVDLIVREMQKQLNEWKEKQEKNSARTKN